MLIAPSMLSADFANLQRDIEMVNQSEAALFHLDIMDGLFVPNISYGFPVVKAIAKYATKPLDAHLMIVDPDRYIPQFAQLGVKYLSVHYEACTHLHRTLQLIRSNGMLAGVALNPHTPVSHLEDILSQMNAEKEVRVKEFQDQKMLVEAERIKKRVEYDIRMRA